MSSEILFYDLEVMKGYFSNTIKRKSDEKVFQYSFHPRGRWDRFDEMLEHYQSDNWLVGYNSIHFDDRLIQWLSDYLNKPKTYSQKGIISDLYNFAQKVIDDETNKYAWGDGIKFNSIDLMRVAHVDKSLKMIAVNLEWDIIQDLPYSHDHEVQTNEVQKILDYNLNDVEITERLYEELNRDIQLRQHMSKKFGQNLMSESNSSMAKKLLAKMYSERSGESYWDFKDKRTDYEEINLSEVVSDKISFESDELNDLLDRIKNSTIKKKEGSNKFESLEFHVSYEGTRYKIARGGIHSENEHELYESTEEYSYRELDWSSFYPFIMIQLGIYPSHLNESFLDLFEDLVNERLQYKKENKDTESDALKILINSVFGRLGNEYSWMYDPKAMFAVTINGQLFMLMLIEIMEKNGFSVCYSNTDGIFCKVQKDRYEEFQEIYKNFEDYTGFVIDDEEFNKLLFQHVNSYILEKADGSLKRAGDLDKEGHRGSWGIMRSFDKPVVAKAIENYFFNKTPVEETIKNHDDPMHFCMAQKAGSKFDVMRRYIEDGEMKTEQLQKTNRYFISDPRGDVIYKTDGSKEISMAGTSGEHVLIYNRKDQYPRGRVKDQYYVKECLKITNQFDFQQKSLF